MKVVTAAEAGVFFSSCEIVEFLQSLIFMKKLYCIAQCYNPISACIGAEAMQY